QVLSRLKSRTVTASQQALIKACAQSENNDMYAEYNARNASALETLLNKHGVQLRQMPDDVLNEIGAASGEVVGEVGDVDEIGRKVYNSFISFRKNVIPYAKISERAYSDARNLPFRYAR
ncbi:MAG: ABC transporter substrate-binding protein, partial [Alphaproteobacteria bacterium]|nr:ABC transporter substrate-binding protein [Alphaproteobacteria bacterium]